jgi:hypothetical protein
MSSGGNALYLSSGDDLYSLNTSTGAATLIGDTGLPIGGMVVVDGTLYAGADNGGAGQIYTINTSDGAATYLSTISGTPYDVWGLAQPTASTTPEPGYLALVGAGLASLVLVRRRRMKSQA